RPSRFGFSPAQRSSVRTACSASARVGRRMACEEIEVYGRAGFARMSASWFIRPESFLLAWIGRIRAAKVPGGVPRSPTSLPDRRCYRTQRRERSLRILFGGEELTPAVWADAALHQQTAMRLLELQADFAA